MDIKWERQFHTDEPRDQYADIGTLGRFWAECGPGREVGWWWYTVYDRSQQNLIVANACVADEATAKEAVRQWAEKNLKAQAPDDARLMRLVRELASNYHNNLLSAESAMDAIAAAVL